MFWFLAPEGACWLHGLYLVDLPLRGALGLPSTIGDLCYNARDLSPEDVSPSASAAQTCLHWALGTFMQQPATQS